MKNITGILIPQSVTSIEQNAFYHCAGIKVIDLVGDSMLKNIGIEAFAGCTGVEEITISRDCNNNRETGIYWLGKHRITDNHSSIYQFR